MLLTSWQDEVWPSADEHDYTAPYRRFIEHRLGCDCAEVSPDELIGLAERAGLLSVANAHQLLDRHTKPMEVYVQVRLWRCVCAGAGRSVES
jgi:hypothetical protein